jgi:hypothetical protein
MATKPVKAKAKVPVKAPARKIRKFREGGSVMDSPSYDMRDPAYRKQLEKKQALETSTEDLELLLGVGAAKKGAGLLLKDLKNFTQRAPSRSITRNIEIGSKTPEVIYKKEYDRLRRMADDALAQGRKVPEKELKEKAEYWTQYELKKLKDNKLPSRKDLVKQEVKDRALKTAENAFYAASLEMAPKALKSLQNREEKPAAMKKGGAVKKPTKSKVNQSANYTKPTMRKRLFEQIKGSATQGTAAGQWSARKAQLLAKKYKEAGGGYK